jgi:hypothetical protein
MKLSIFLAGFRNQNWVELYESIPNTTTLTDYEVVFVGPYAPPPGLAEKENVVFVKDFGCPSRCYQLGLLHSRGEYVVWATDDGIFSPGLAVDAAFASIPKHRKGLVSFTFTEGATAEQRMFGQGIPESLKRAVDKMKRASTDMKMVFGENPALSMCGNAHYKVVMNALIRNDYLKEIGGWDCRFAHIGVGSNDLAVRLQNDGAEVVMGGRFMDLTQEWSSQDHLPIENTHADDMALLSSIYPAPRARTNIDFDNWKLAPDRWSRRQFKES